MIANSALVAQPARISTAHPTRPASGATTTGWANQARGSGRPASGALAGGLRYIKKALDWRAHGDRSEDCGRPRPLAADRPSAWR